MPPNAMLPIPAAPAVPALTASRIACLTASLIPTLALAHPGGMAAHSTFVAGLAHPLGGADHLLAMVAVGWLAARIGGQALWSVPLAFVALMVGGGLLALTGIALPLVETLIAVSVIVLGLALIGGRRLTATVAMALVGFFAVFHGHAHLTEMPIAGVDGGPLAYGAGFVLATACLHLVGIGLGLLAERAAGRAAWVTPVAAAVLAVSGLVILIPPSA